MIFKANQKWNIANELNEYCYPAVSFNRDDGLPIIIVLLNHSFLIKDPQASEIIENLFKDVSSMSTGNEVILDFINRNDNYLIGLVDAKSGSKIYEYQLFL